MGDRNYYPNQYPPRYYPQARGFRGMPRYYAEEDDYYGSPSYQYYPERRFHPHDMFYQQSPAAFYSDYVRRSDYKFSQSNQRGLAKQNQNRGRRRGGRGRRNKKNSGQQNTETPKDGGSLKGQDSSKEAEGAMSGSEDNVDDKNIDLDEQGGSDDEDKDEDKDDGEGDNRAFEKVNVYIPDPTLVTKYEYYPPSPEEMGEMFKDLVIHFFYKLPRNRKVQNPFVVICEAFRRSAGYYQMEVEDGHDTTFEPRKFCTLKYRGVMLVRGVGENNCIKEPRVLAGVELINKLAMSCYTLESKSEYFGVEAHEKQQEQGSVPGVFTIAPKEEAHDYDSARNYLQLMISKEEDSDVEYMFTLPNKELAKLKRWAKMQQPKFDVRSIKDEWIGIYRQRTPQYWRDKILATDSMETEKFILKPPQGIGNQLLSNFDIRESIGQLREVTEPIACTLQTVYGPPGVGPNVKEALPPWDRRRGAAMYKKSQQKTRRILKLAKEGVPLTEVKDFKFLSKKKKQLIKKLLAKGSS